MVFLEYLQYILHERPDELNEEVKAHVNNLCGKADSVFLGYAWCGSLKGITSELKVPTAMIETDDCTSALLTPAVYLAECRKCAGTYYATPHISRNNMLERYYDKFTSEVDEKSIADVGPEWFVKQYFDGYNTDSLCLFRVGRPIICEGNSKKFANHSGWKYEMIQGCLDILEDSFRYAKDLAAHIDKVLQ